MRASSVAVRFRRNTGGWGVLIIMALSCAPCKKYIRNSHVTAVWGGRDSAFFFRAVRFWLSPRILDLTILFSKANLSHCAFDHNSHELNASICRRFAKVHRHFGVRFFSHDAALGVSEIGVDPLCGVLNKCGGRDHAHYNQSRSFAKKLSHNMSYIVLAGGALHLRAMRYGWVKVDSALPTWYYSQVAAPCEKSNPTRLLSLLFRWMQHLKEPSSHCIVRSSENRSQKDDSLFSGAPLVLEYTINWMTSSRENNRPLYYSSILMARNATVIIRPTPSAFRRCYSYISLPHINIAYSYNLASVK